MKKIFNILFPFFFVFALISCSNDLNGSLVLKMPGYSDGSRAADAVGNVTLDGESTSIGGNGSAGTSTSNGTSSQNREPIFYELEIDGPTKTKIQAEENELVRIDNLIAGTYDVTCTAFYESDKSFFASGKTCKITVEPFKETPAKVKLEHKTLAPTIKSVVVEPQKNETSNGFSQAKVTVTVCVNQRGTVSLSDATTTTTTGWISNQSGSYVVDGSTANQFKKEYVFEKSIALKDSDQTITVKATFTAQEFTQNSPSTVEFTIKLPAKNDGNSGGGVGSSDDANGSNDTIDPPSPSVSQNFNYYETPTKIDSTNGSSNNHYYFGIWPQSLKDASVTVDENTEYTINGWACYKANNTDDYYVKKNCESTAYSGMTSGQDYYFKLEPIEWISIGSSNGQNLFLADKVLYGDYYFEYKDGNNYRTISVNGINASVYPNNYAYSKVRTWLNSLSGIEGVEDFSNSGFLGMAFTDSAKSHIVQTTVKNQKADTYKNQNNPLTGNGTLTGETDTNDKIFLLSLAEATDSAYTFGDYETEFETRKKFATPYAAACGTYLGTNNTASRWWLRTSDYTANSTYPVFTVSESGKANDTKAIYGTNSPNTRYKYGLVPAMWVKAN